MLRYHYKGYLLYDTLFCTRVFRVGNGPFFALQYLQKQVLNELCFVNTGVAVVFPRLSQITAVVLYEVIQVLNWRHYGTVTASKTRLSLQSSSVLPK